MNKAYYHNINLRSTALRQRLLATNKPFRFPLKELLEAQNELVLNSPEALGELLEKLAIRITTYAQQLNATDALPVLMQAVTDFYRQKSKVYPNNIGLALKSSCTFLSEQVWTTANPKENSLVELEQLVNAVLLYESLHSAYLFYYFVRNIKLTINEKGIRTPIQYQGLNEEVFRLTSKTNAFRTIHDIIKIIWHDLEGFQQKVAQVLIRKKNDIAFFKGTIFEAIPADCIDFWLGVYLRLYICRHLLHQAAQTWQTDKLEKLIGIQVFQEFQVQMIDFAPPALIADCIKKLFWEKSLAFDGLFNERGNLLAHRPIVRISCDPLCYVSAPYLLLDSLHTFVEASIMDYQIPTAASLPASIFETFIATNFEKQVLALFQNICAKVGAVSAKGVWKVGEEYIKLSDKPSPGQIDVLAVDEQQKLVYLVEAKVLKDPFSFNAFRNVVKKVGRADDARFHAKLAKKGRWIEKIDASFSGYQTFVLLVLDRYVPLAWQADHVVLDVEQLDHLITNGNLLAYCQQKTLPNEN